MNVDSTPGFVEEAYKKMERNLAVVRSRLNRPLTLAEKLLLGHLDDAQNSELDPGESYIMLNPDRVAHQGGRHVWTDTGVQLEALLMRAGGRELGRAFNELTELKVSQLKLKLARLDF